MAGTPAVPQEQLTPGSIVHHTPLRSADSCISVFIPSAVTDTKIQDFHLSAGHRCKMLSASGSDDGGENAHGVEVVPAGISNRESLERISVNAGRDRCVTTGTSKIVVSLLDSAIPYRIP
jgi:hypothetical protein